jgi:hypothetical protein
MSRRVNLFANLFLTTVLVCLVAALVYAVHRSDFYPPGTMNKFYLVLMGGVLLCAMALRLRYDYKVNFVMSILSISAGVYLFEIFLDCCTNVAVTNPYAQAAKAAGVPFDLRTRQQIFLDLVKEGTELYPSANVSQIVETGGIELAEGRISPLAGMSGKTTLLCNESGEYGLFLADEHGFNNPLGLYAPGEVDIVLIGDSFTHGSCVSAGEDIASHLRNRGKKAINLGYSGKGPLLELATLQEYAEPLKPPVVLWIYYEENDLEDLAIEQQSATLLNYLDRDYSQDLFNRQAEVDEALVHYLDKVVAELKEKRTEDAQFSLNTQLTRIIRLSNLRQLLTNVFSAPPPPPPPSPLFEEVLKEARDRTSAWGGRLYFVYLPAWQRYGTKIDPGNAFHRDQVLSIVAKLGIPLIDMHEVISQQPDPLSLFPFRLHGHYLAEGYELMASNIQAYLEKDRSRVSTQ